MKRRNDGKLPPAKKPMYVSFEEPETYVEPKNDETIDNSSLAELDPEEIAALKNFKREQLDDMDQLSHLNSAKTRVFEKARLEDDEDDEEFEKFTTESEEARKVFRDPLAKHQISKRKNREKETVDHWFYEYMESQKVKKGTTFSSIDASLARQARQNKQNNDMKDDDENDLNKLSGDEILREISNILKEKETIAQSLRRLSGMPQTGKRNRNSQKKPIETQTSQQDTKQFDVLTELTTICTNRKYFSDIYSVTREEILERLGKQSLLNQNIKVVKSNKIDLVRGEAIKKTAGNMWEYKVSKEESNIFGPFDTPTMKIWMDQVSMDDFH